MAWPKSNPSPALAPLGHPLPQGERVAAARGDALRACRLTRSVESRFSHRLTIRWRIETLFHTIELQHPGSERAATIADEADAKSRRAGTDRHFLRRRAGRAGRTG